MLNRIWFWLILLGILYAFGKGAYHSVHPPAQGITHPDAPEAGLVATGKALNKATLDAAGVSVEICIEMIGIMALWLGLLKVAEDAGLVAGLSWLLRPIMRWLFPGVPDGHPAQGAMLMNISANMLGLDNAATPLGLKAMQELQTLNPHKDTASNAMATFLALNTSGLTLIPFAIIGYRAAAHSKNAVEPMGGILIATAFSTVVAIVAVRWLAQRPRYAIPENVRGESP